MDSSDDEQVEFESEFADVISTRTPISSSSKLSKKIIQGTNVLFINESPLLDIIQKIFQKKVNLEEIKDIQSYINEELSLALILDKSNHSSQFINLLKTFETLFTKDPISPENTEYTKSFNIIKKMISDKYSSKKSGDTDKDENIVKKIEDLNI